MRGSLLVTFDENLDGRGTQFYSVTVDGLGRDTHYTDSNNLYSTYLYTGNTVIFTVDRNSYLYKSEVSIKRLDYTNDDENGDRGVKETIINPVITYTNTTSIYTFTATTISAAYDFYYVIECTTSFCYDNSLGFAGGTDPSVTDIDILSTGKLIVSGEYTTYRGTSANRVVQLNDDGTIYSGFSYGSGFTPDTTNQVVELSNGKLIFVGQFTNYNGTSCTRIIGLNADGTVYTGFTTGTGFNGDPGPIERQSDDKVIVGGRFWTYNGTTSPKIVRINTNGTIDNTFVVGSGFTSGGTYTDLNVEVSCLAIQSDGKIIVGGTFDAYRGTSANRLVRINTDGSYDTSFSGVTTGFNSLPVSIKIQTDGKILVGGYFTSYNGTTRNRLVRLNSDGSYDTSFSGFTTGFNAEVLAIEFTYDNNILCGGNFTTINGSNRLRLAGLNPNGSVLAAAALSSGINARVDSLAVLPDGDIYVGGIFTNIQGVTVQRFARLGRNGLVYSCQETTSTPTPTPTLTPTITPTFTPTPTPTPTPTVNPDADDIMVASVADSNNVGIYDLVKSLDAGNTFIKLASFNVVVKPCCSRDGQTIYYQDGGAGTYIKKSTDGGSTFTTTNFLALNNSQGLICNRDGSIIVTWMRDDTNPLMYVRISNDGGNTYSDFNYNPGPYTNNVPWSDVCLTSSGFPMFMVGGRDNNRYLKTLPVYTLTGFTSTIQPYSSISGRFRSVCSSNNGGIVAIGDSSTVFNASSPVYITQNSGSTYNNPITLREPKVKMSTDGKYILATDSSGDPYSTNDKVYLSTDSGTTFNEIPELTGLITNAGDLIYKVQVSASGKNMYIAAPTNYVQFKGLWVSNNYGSTWTNIFTNKYNQFFKVYAPK
jgi:uncharacterized delta-60 repeat protein